MAWWANVALFGVRRNPGTAGVIWYFLGFLGSEAVYVLGLVRATIAEQSRRRHIPALCRNGAVRCLIRLPDYPHRNGF
jgi:hypothetical protein